MKHDINAERPTLLQALEVMYGPALLAVLFAYAVNVEQSYEVIYSSFSDFSNPVLARYRGGENIDMWMADSASAFATAFVRVFVLACIPAAVIHASRWTLRIYGIPHTKLQIPLPEVFGAFVIGGYIFALWSGLEIVRHYNEANVEILGNTAAAATHAAHAIKESTELFVLGTILFVLTTAVYLLFFVFLMRVGRWHHLRRLEGSPLANLVSFGLALGIIVFFLANALLPGLASFLGPVALSGGMLVVWIYALSGLTILSFYYRPLGFPWIYFLGFLAVIAGGATAASRPLIIILLLGSAALFADGLSFVGFFRGIRLATSNALTSVGAYLGRLLHFKLSSLERAWIGIFLISLVGYVGHKSYAGCESFAGCNIVRATVPSEGEGSIIRAEDGSAALTQWQSSDNRQEVTLLAARGGGIYAAYHAAYYLAAVADLDEDAARSLFAVSGISGGSVGAGIFWAIRMSGLCDIGEVSIAGNPVENECHRDAVTFVLRQDYLSPVLATLFTRDVVDSFVPISILSRQPMDRGSTFEHELARHFDNWVRERCREIRGDLAAFRSEDTRDIALSRCGADDNLTPQLTSILTRPLTQTWQGMPHQEERAVGAPLLLFGAVDVNSGELRVMSPLRILGRRQGFLEIQSDDDDYSGDISLVSAMVASARFPFVTPPLRALHAIPLDDEEDSDASRGDWEHIQLSDGGFFDSSGLEAIWDILLEIQGSEQRPQNIRVIFLELSGETEESTGARGAIGAPVSAFLASWRSRLRTTRCRFEHLAGSTADGSGGLGVILETVTVNLEDGLAENFTLSWFLSRGSREIIRSQIDVHVALNSKPASEECI